MASAVYNGHVNGGANGAANGAPTSKRFSDVPAVLDVPVRDQEDEAVEIDLMNLLDDPSDLCDLFETEQAARTYWMAVALAYAKLKRVDYAIEVLIRGGNAVQNINPREKLSMLACLCWMYLWKSREAPRVAPEGQLVAEAKTKEYYLQLATTAFNEASRINPAFPPLFLAKGVLFLLKASLQPPSKSGGDQARTNELLSAIRSFDDAIRVSQGRNMLAVMGKARANFSLGKYPEALSGYQEVLQKMPDLVDPDPRIGIGCCFWQLGFKDDARTAWERCLEINPDSKTANILLGLYYLDASGHVPTNSPEFIRLYKKAMTEYTQKSFKLDKNLPLTCATFASYFLSRKNFPTVEALAHKAIQYTDVNAIASDGWYQLARTVHYTGDVDRANNYYQRADEARGGNERGYLPAKFGSAQLLVVRGDPEAAKFQLDKILKQSRSHEAMILLGTLLAEEVFANEYAAVREDKTEQQKRAISLLESARSAWKDPKKNIAPDASVLLNLARLYEVEHPEKALQCLQQVEQLELEQVPQPEDLSDPADEATTKAALRKFLPPQLLNNIGCFYYQGEKLELASEMFEAALSACVRAGEKEDDNDTDALVTTISFNLGRSYEARGMSDKAVEVYEGLLARHDDYLDAKTRLAYIKLRKNPNKGGPDAVAKLYQENSSDLEVRALYGWFLGKAYARKRPANINEDPELRHYKHTLQHYEKHDRYALVGMGNLYLVSAREMRRESEQDKQKRSSTYSRAVEFFEKALQLDPKNAYAAQGIAIALVEDKKDHRNALSILLKVRDTVKDPHVFTNLGHVYAELKQYSKAIESYEAALSKEGRANDPAILACLGRTWLLKARAEKDVDSYMTALEWAKKALEVSPEQVHFKFNVAFVQTQLVSLIQSKGDAQRTLQQLQDAAEGLESAIKTLDEIAAHPQPPYPKHDLEQRANMARNTLRKQLERAIASQKEYEEKNKEKLAAALEQRQAELRRREAERQRALDKERERQEKIRREREEIAVRDRELAEQRATEERARQEAEMTTDSETGEKVKRKRKAPRAARDGGERPRSSKGGRARRKKSVEDGDESADEEARQPKKKRRLTAKKDNAKYKSAEIVVDSDDDSDDGRADAEREMRRERSASSAPSELPSIHGDSDDGEEGSGGAGRMEVDGSGPARGSGGGGAAAADEDDEDEAAGRRQQSSRRARRGRVVDESDEDEDEDEGGGAVAGAAEEHRSDDDDEAAAPADTSMVDADDDE